MTRVDIYIHNTPTRTADSDWDENKHKRATNGQFGSGGGGKKPDPKATPAKSEAENNAAGREGVWEQEQKWKAKFPKGSKVKTPSGRPVEVISHQGNMLQTTEGLIHATKVDAVK